MGGDVSGQSPKTAAETALDEERRRVADVLAGTRAGIWEWNLQTGEVIVDERCAAILGYSLTELTPISIERWRQLAHPEDLARSQMLLDKHLAGALDDYGSDLRVRHKAGHWVWVRDRGQVSTWAEDGQPLLMGGMRLDINDHKLTEESLRRNLEEVQRVNRLMQGREARIRELKAEVNALRAEKGEPPAYGTAMDTADPRIQLLEARTREPGLASFVTQAAHPVVDRSLEKPDVSMAFIPILCSAPLLYAKTHGYFARNGLDVTLVTAPGWSGIKDLLAFGHVDAAHLLAPMPLAIREGMDGRRAPVRLAAVQNVNGQALTLSIRHRDLVDVREMKGFTFAVPYFFSMHYYLLCLFLAEHGLDPLKDVTIIEVPPPRMPHFLATDRVDGIFAPEPFNQIPAYRGTGFIYRLSRDIWPGHPCCCFASSEDFSERYPRTYRAMLDSVVEAELHLHRAGPEERRAIAIELSQPGVLGQADPEPVMQALAGEYDDGLGGHHCVQDRIDFLPTPWPDYGGWILSQQQRWGQLRRQVDYRAVVDRCFDASTQEIAAAFGFAEPGPRRSRVAPFSGGDAFAEMRTQPFCAFTETDPEPPATVQERIERLARVVSAEAGGLSGYHERIHPRPDDALGELEQVVADLIKNVHFAADALAEKNETLEAQVAARVAEIDAARRNALSIAEDADAARRSAVGMRRQLETLNRHLEDQTGLAQEMAVKAERLAEAKGEFLATMSHEIRTPMNAVLGLAHLLEQQPLPAEARILAQKIHQSGRSLLAIINDILDYSKIESGRIEIERMPFRLSDVLDNLATIMAASATGKDLDLAIQPPGGPDLDLVGDPLRLGQILINLTTNAIKFTPAGLVKVRVELIERAATRIRLRFSVEDTGIGIAPETQARLFQPFMQADTSTTRRFGGTGLGLAISRRLVDLMGGHMGLESRLDEGSTFWLELGFDLAERVSAEDAEAGRALQVLVADDSRTIRRAVVDTIETLGWATLEAESGGEALRHVLGDAKLQHPDALVLLDWQMPGLDGVATARAIHEALPADARPLVLLFTAYPVEKIQTLPGVEAVDGILSKPLTSKTLFEAVKAAHRRRMGEDVDDGPRVASEHRLAGRRVLVVDDSEINREVAERIFTNEGAEVHLLCDGEEAVKWLAAHPDSADMVLMDLRMPGMDGFAATRLIRKDPRTARIPIVALTADVIGGQSGAVLDAGMDDFLSKPIEVSAAVALILRLTGQGRSIERADAHQLADEAVDSEQPARTLAEGASWTAGSAPAEPETLAAPEPEPACEDELEKSLPGINLKHGLEIFGNLETYWRFVRRFIASYAGVTAALTAADPSDAVGIAHKLKGTAANLGLMDVASRAAELEQRLKSDRQEAPLSMDQQVGDLQDALDALQRVTPQASASSDSSSPSPQLPSLTPRR